MVQLTMFKEKMDNCVQKVEYFKNNVIKNYIHIHIDLTRLRNTRISTQNVHNRQLLTLPAIIEWPMGVLFTDES